MTFCFSNSQDLLSVVLSLIVILFTISNIPGHTRMGVGGGGGVGGAGALFVLGVGDNAGDGVVAGAGGGAGAFIFGADAVPTAGARLGNLVGSGVGG